jgi:MYXO-CTERM domain-containing protein
MTRRDVGLLTCLLLLPAGNAGAQPNLTLNNQTLTLFGVKTYNKVTLTNGSKIIVPTYTGNKNSSGNLQIKANSILIDATSSIVADAKGYQPVLCGAGNGPNATGGGRGGCAVRDSGGGGAHFGRGGRGTKDCFIVAPTNSCQFPQEFEEACGAKGSGNSCTTVSGCYNNDALPSVAGVAYQHSIYKVEFGAAGGDKGCRDGDGWSCRVSGAGGGRIVLAAVNSGKSGTLTIQGTVSANGQRGCGDGNDSGGGGAGGSLLLVGDKVTIGVAAKIRAAGALGGDTNAKQPGSGCPSCSQNPGGTCDDCGGGGGGGIISVLSGVPATIASKAAFDVSGADGGTCPICKGEAGGGAGELQLSGKYIGELCDGYDNDFDGQVDEGLGNVTCGSGACAKTVAQCKTSTNPALVYPNDCIPSSTSSCQPALTDTRGRFLVIVDSSGSMLTDLSGAYTFGDGSTGHAGLDTNKDGKKNDSRLYKAKQALTNVISAYPEIDFALARFAQGVDLKVNCQLAHWFECAGLCCTYDNPTNNSGGTPPGGACTVSAGGYGNVTVQPTSPGDECINYAGSCGQPRRGADILVGFEKPINQSLMWLNNTETKFFSSTVEGNHCNYAGGGDCELRGTGPTPLAGSLYSAKAFLGAAKASDKIGSCRGYSVILLTDGAETCLGAPALAAADLLKVGIETYVVGFSVLASEKAQLNSIAKAGSTGGSRNAFFVGDEKQLAATMASIVADTILFEKCNGLDDDCDLLIDEDFPLLGQPCNNGKLGICYKTGKYVCKADGSGVRCNAPNATGVPEKCNGLDDDCDGQIDEIPGCIPCLAQPEICNGKDDDCDKLIDEGIPSGPCGKSVGQCKPGVTKCVNGKLVCSGGTAPTTELCNGLDDDCDGAIDGMSEQCYSFASGCKAKSPGPGYDCTGFCKPGFKTCTKAVWGACQGEIGPGKELCNGLDDDCDGAVDEQAECPSGSTCVEGACTLPCGSGEFVCPKGQLCKNGWCVLDPCDPTQCPDGHVCKAGQCFDPCQYVSCGKYETCVKGTCVDQSCYNPANTCPPGQLCVQGKCVADACAGVSCAADQYCDDGSCTKLCATVTCPAGQLCKAGVCVADPCASQTCGEGWVCVGGKCVSDPCKMVSCEQGQICIDGTCVADPCETISCPQGFNCKQGQCVNERVIGSSDMLATGAGGLACSIEGRPSSGPPGALLLLLLGLVLRRQQRREPRGGRRDASRRGERASNKERAFKDER